MSDENIEVVATEVTEPTISILIDPANTLHTGKPVILNINGSELKLPVGEPIPIPAALEQTLRDCSIAFEATGDRDQDVLDVPGADVSGVGTEGGLHADAADRLSIDPAAEVHKAKLLAMLDQSIPALTVSLEGLTMDELDLLLAAESIGKTRAGAVKAIEIAQQALIDNPAD